MYHHYLYFDQVSIKSTLNAVLAQAEGCAICPEGELNDFIQNLVPAEPAKIAATIWSENYTQFEAELCDAYNVKLAKADAYSQNLTRIRATIESMIQKIVVAIQHMIRIMSFGTRVVLMSNFYVWKQSALAVSGLAGKFIPALY